MANMMQMILDFTKNRTISKGEFRDIHSMISSQNKNKSNIITKKKSTNYNNFSNFTVETEDQYKFIRDYSFVKTILQIIKSTIMNLLSDKDLEIESDKEGDKKVLERINKDLKELDVLNEFLKGIEDFLFYGSYLMILHNDKLKSAYPQESPFTYYLALWDPDYQKKEDEEDFVIIKREGVEKKLKYKNCLLLQNNPRIEEYSIGEDYIMVNSITIGQSIFRGSVSDICWYMEKIYTGNVFSFKEVLRPDIVVSNFAENTSDADRIDTTQKIEEAVNDRESASILNNSPYQIMAIIQNKLMNSVRSLPNIQGVTGHERYEYNSSRERKQLIDEDRQRDKEMILQNMRIPKELFDGEGKREEIESRADNYKDLIASIMVSLDISVTQWVRQKYDDHRFGKLTSTFNPRNFRYFSKKSDSLQEQVDELSKYTELMNAVSNFLSTEGFETEALVELMGKYMNMNDPLVLAMIDAKVKSLLKEKEEQEQGMSEGMEGEEGEEQSEQENQKGGEKQ